jgi:predicted RNA binding protein YcfA (HicA-like mRNA interferase family)
MSKLPSFTSKKLIKILKKFGFQLDHTTGSHFIFYNLRTKKRAVVPYHFKDLPKGTLMSILKEAGITREDLEKILKKGKIK